MDWAMKFLPTSFRETQRDWFGKKGKSWHVTVAVTKSNSDNIEARTYVHLFDECTQNWFAVASILEHTLTTVKEANPSIQEAFLRSDNAGCYHCAYLILSLPSLGDRAGIKIARYDFSDPQAGKDVCDRRIATVKSHMRRYINEGHDIRSASDMKAAIDSYGGVKGCQAAVVKVQEYSHTMKKHTMSGIQALNNFSFESEGLRVWKAYNVGPGKLFSPVKVKGFGTPQGPTDLCVLQPFSIPREETGAFRSTTRRAVLQQAHPSTSQSLVVEDEPPASEATKVYFSCPEDGCTKTYQSYGNLQKHLDAGKHLLRLERETTYDSIKKKWADTCTEVSRSYLRKETGSSTEDAVDHPVCKIPQGWALKTWRRTIRFTEKVKTHLKSIFLEGEETGRKASAADVCSKMRTQRDESGRKIFAKEEWLAADQIARYFSRLSVLYRSGRLALEQVNRESPEDEEEDYVAEVEEITTRLEIQR
ncbi:uncharacterized protein [Montipora foliosa]|uniref:uncharacterized protein n=1 Tax=Montipora foliosa TaxID=591990 RepID=UPI0035F1AA97